MTPTDLLSKQPNLYRHQTMALPTTTIGYPRIGPKREMKVALESYWAGKLSEEDLLATAHQVDEGAWKAQAEAGIDLVGLDGTLYDHILDFALTYLGLVPPRFQVRIVGVVVSDGNDDGNDDDDDDDDEQ